MRVLHKKRGELSYILMYIDDIIIVSKNKKWSEEIKSKLACDFDVKDSGDIKFCLGIAFSRRKGKILINQ